jgi:SEFIR domain-containing protein
MTVDVPKVFVSYAHESDEHKAQVLEFATFLRRAGIEAVLDLWSADARQDWYAWAIREMTDADFVLVVASGRYRAVGDGSGPSSESRGVQSEAALLRELVYADRASWLRKVLPVLLPGGTTDQIPLFLQPHTASRFHVTSFDATGAEELLRVILRRPGHVPPEMGTEPPVLPPRTDGADRTASDGPSSGRGRVFNQVNGNVTGTVIQADTITGDINL